jgi:hypothetical protein
MMQCSDCGYHHLNGTCFLIRSVERSLFACKVGNHNEYPILADLLCCRGGNADMAIDRLLDLNWAYA